MEQELEQPERGSNLKISVPVAFLLSLVCAMGGVLITDRVTQASTNSTSAAEIQQIKKQLDTQLGNNVPADGYRREMDSVRESLKNYVPREEFTIFSTDLTSRLDEMRTDLREIKQDLRHR